MSLHFDSAAPIVIAAQADLVNAENQYDALLYPNGEIHHPHPGTVDDLILAGLQRAEQVIGNLVSNALRYVPEGGRVWITIEKTADSVSLLVSDNGPAWRPKTCLESSTVSGARKNPLPVTVAAPGWVWP